MGTILISSGPWDYRCDMETILKLSETAANAIIDPYLTWAQGQAWYGADCGKKLYDDLRKKVTTGVNNRQKLIDEVLLPEQDNRCCYCMRQIADHNDEASIEHIIPKQTISPNQMNRYFTLRSGGLNSRNVCLTSYYVNRGNVGAPYPHHVAYHNFAVACKQCNNGRGSAEIEPLFLYRGIKNEVTYDQQTGEAEWTHDPAYNYPLPELPTLEKVNLNRPILKAIRSVWFYSKRNGINPAIANRDDLVCGAIGESLCAQPAMNDEEFNAYLSLTTDGIWDIMLKYDYFG